MSHLSVDVGEVRSHRQAMRRLSTAFAFAAACAAAQMCGQRPAGAEVAYVTDNLRDVVSVIDTATQRISDVIPVGAGIRPCGIATSPDGRTLYAANPRPNSLSIVDLASFTASSVFLNCSTDACDPSSVVVSPDGHFVYALSEEFDDTFARLAVSEIDARAHAVTRTFEVRTDGVSSGCDVGAIAAGGRLLYVRVVSQASPAPFALSVIDIASGSEVGRIVSPRATDLVATPSGDRIVAVTPEGLAIIAAETQAIERMVPIDGKLGAITLSPDGLVAYVVKPCEIVVVDLAGAAVKTTIPLGSCDGGLPIVTRDGGLLLVAQLTDPSAIVEISTATDTVEKTVYLEEQLGSLAVGVDRNTLYVANGVPGLGYGNRLPSAGGLLEFDLRTDAFTRRLSPAGPSAVAATPEGGHVYVVNALSNEVAVIDARLKRVQARIPVAAPSALAIDPTGSRIFAGSSDARQGGIAAIDRLSASIVNSTHLDAPVSALAVSPDGGRVYAATGGYGPLAPPSIVVLNAETLARIDTISTDTPFTSLTFAGDGHALYAARWQYGPNEVTGGVTFIDPMGERDPTILDTGGGVVGFAISPDQQTIYAPSWYYLLGQERSTLAVIDAVSSTVRTSVPIEERAGRVAITSAGDSLYIVSNRYVSIVDTETLETTATIEAGVYLADVAIAPDPSCIGDCDGNGVVAIAELVTMVNVALAGDAAFDSCPGMSGWCDVPGSPTISCLIGAVLNALNGCDR